MITYKTTKKLNHSELFTLYKSVNWIGKGKNISKHGELLSQTYASSDGVVSAWEGKELIGVARFITDQHAHGMIYGLAVKPKHQGQGIGTTLIKKCMSAYPKIQWAAEIEDKKTLSLFTSLGFTRSKNVLVSIGKCPV